MKVIKASLRSLLIVVVSLAIDLSCGFGFILPLAPATETSCDAGAILLRRPGTPPLFAAAPRPSPSSSRVPITHEIIIEPNNSKRKMEQSCQFCEERFASRNALFRHLRTNADCFQRASEASGKKGSSLLSKHQEQQSKQKCVIRFGYISTETKGDENINDLAAEHIKRAFVHVMSKRLPALNFHEQQETMVLTMASSAKHRQQCLAQDPDCFALSDFACISFMGTDDVKRSVLSTVPEDNEVFRADMQRELDDDSSSSSMKTITVRVLGVAFMPMSTRFHAEELCTQRIYHYIVPLSWFGFSGDEAKRWWQAKLLENASKNGNPDSHRPRGSIRPPGFLTKLKRILKSFESDEGDESEKDPATSTGRLLSPGRYGSLWKKERQCWHNFADPALGGLASPSNDPVWRTIDTAKMNKLMLDESDHGHVVLEFRGDGFTTQQVRRMVGSLVAMMNDQLPEEFISLATRSDIQVQTPLAPVGRCYMAGGRYHFLEVSNGSSVLDEKGSEDLERWRSDFERSICVFSRQHVVQDKQWLHELDTNIAPMLRKQVCKIHSDDQVRAQATKNDGLISSNSQLQTKSVQAKLKTMSKTSPPDMYHGTLSLLREIVRDNAWPKTSKARSRLIREVGPAETMNSNNNLTPGLSTEDGVKSGSFTVINPELADLPEDKLPLGNQLFPELVSRIFALERDIARSNVTQYADGVRRRLEGATRPLSTHCAVNQNAEFVPHVDSGTGRGQDALSLIVGLGDYVGGSIVVEGQSSNIRFDPLEFDGWKQRHWTEPFQGERFSLVWFTPSGIPLKGGAAPLMDASCT